MLNLLGTDWMDIITGIEKGMAFYNEYDGKFPDDIEIIVWKKLLYTYGYSEDALPDEGMFLCVMKDKQYGFFSTRIGSCGYNTCPVGGSYASFYVGSYENVCNLGMDDEARHWNLNK